MKFKQNKSGFTLLEIIIVIIIVGVLASLALPRFFSTVEFSRSTEALNAMGVLRQSVERCFVANNEVYTGCVIGAIDVEDPGAQPNTHFTYLITVVAADAYNIVATRNGTDGGNVGDTITLTQPAAGAAVTRAGTGAFVGIR